MSGLVTQAEFAAILGCDKAYVTRLKQAGRLVMADGKVDVEASKKRIEETSDPSRAEHGKSASPSIAFNEAKARNELAKAEIAEMERDKMRGTLVDADEVKRFASNLGATFRGALEILPDRIAPELVPLSDADAIRAVLVDAFEQILSDLSIKIEKGI